MNNNYVVLNNIEHQNTKVITTRGAQFGDNVDYAPTFPLEFRNIQACYPIFIRKDHQTGQFSPVALFGFEAGENLFLDDNGWDANYIPLMIRRHPFIIGFQDIDGNPENKKAIVSIDMNSPRVSETQGEPVFLEHGGVSPFLSSIMEMLETIGLASDMNDDFISTLVELELLEAVTMQIELDNGSNHELIGYYTINEDTLSGLSGDALERLHQEHYLESIYMIIASMTSFRSLVERKNARQNAS